MTLDERKNWFQEHCFQCSCSFEDNGLHDPSTPWNQDDGVDVYICSSCHMEMLAKIADPKT